MIRFLFVFLFTALCLPSFSSFSAELPIANKHNNNAPIEINSDALEVLQAEGKAIFTGHVVAVQGDVNLKSEKMTVFYKAQDKKSDEKKSNIAPSPSAENAIEKIIVEKNVFLTTAEETASGENGIYDVENKKIYLNNNVVLTRDKNILKGDKLVYDFATGKSNLNASNSNENIAEQTGAKPRVKALFIPKSEETLSTDEKK